MSGFLQQPTWQPYSEWARLTELVKMLGSFEEQTGNMQTDTLSLSSVIPSLLELS
jgi:hypothetical protein